MHHRYMFALNNHVTDPRNGRPQAHYSWAGETIVTWTTCAFAAMSLFGTVAFYLKWQQLDGPAQMALASVLLAAMAYWRHTMLVRERAAFRNAVDDHEVMLKKPFG